MNRLSRPVLAVDLGGTYIRTGIVGTDFRVRHRQRGSTPAGSSAELLNGLLELIYRSDRRLYRSVSIGFAGLVSWPDGRIITAPSLPAVTNLPLRRYIQGILKRPVTVDNDATLWTLGEALLGAGRGRRVVAGLTLGTGVGGGLVVDGRVFRGKDNVSEFGHMIVRDGGPADQHGGRGHLESYAGGWSIGRTYARATGRRLSAADVAKRRNPASRRIMADAAHALALALANIIHLMNPDIVVIGGSVARAPGLLTTAKQALPQYLLHPTIETPVVAARLGEDAPLIGAAILSSTR